MTIFQKEYKTAINNILKDVYGGTDYWGKGNRGNEGIIKPITDKDDPNWSNYNFINTHYTVRDNVVEPFVRQNGFKEDIEPNKSYKDSQNNRDYFRILWLKRNELFGSNSKHAPEIIGLINKTRGRGEERESLVGEILNKLPFLDVEMRGAAGSTEDFGGTDAIVNYKGRDYKTQIKPFSTYQKFDDYFVIKTKLIREYKQPLMIFGKKSGEEYHILCFWNRGFEISDDLVKIPTKNMFLAVNFNRSTKKLKYKLND
jgi:hypothetical protein